MPILLTLTAIFVFTGASVFYAEFARKYSALWMNTFKAIVALVAFSLSTIVMLAWGISDWHRLDTQSGLFFFFSGVMGLGVGDIFLLLAYARIGSSRSLMIFSFQPLFIGLQAYFIFGQQVSAYQGLAIFLLIACVFIISFERFREEGRWEIKGIVFAIIGVILDNIGVVMSRLAFDQTGMNAVEANWLRALGAVIVLLLIQKIRREKTFAPLKLEVPRRRAIILVAAFFGTYVSLICWLTAVKTGHLATLSAIGGINPLAAGLWEWALEGKRPKASFIAGFILSAMALGLLVWH